ncbi:DUF3298 and DUF4163 domain-containing protein [Clostridium cylindrosporum]|uniref:Uncharacterized protein n=1 Tax=Clostridium cylindrosporum DSM 605 TaxID=1121307 RepID=A0A0J8DEZ2_CLOCY|nr:DUF3298 and DUF4163 domain-containing protein [Clostridium cylindrosporum]KMT22743.1 hypothetical protein CLCY_11c00770 [Clostridium cylindrosporum DSM 605]
MKRYPSFFIYTFLTLFLCISVLNTANANTLSSPPKISFKEMRYGNDYINVNIKIPMLSYKDNLDVERRINTILEGDIISFKNQVENTAKEAYEESKKDKFNFIPYEAFETYKVTYNNSKILSIPVTFYTYTGGAHGNTIQEPYNFDLETGEKLTLKDIFIEGSNYKNTIKEVIKSSIEENPDIYFDDAIATVDKLQDTQNFYITDDNLVIYYDLYELAPYSSGIREFSIPLYTFSSELNSKYSLTK